MSNQMCFLTAGREPRSSGDYLSLASQSHHQHGRRPHCLGQGLCPPSSRPTWVPPTHLFAIYCTMFYILKSPNYNSCLKSHIMSLFFVCQTTFDIPPLLSCLPLDVKFDAVSGDYYPIVYFNDYWNLQKDYYPINDTLTTLPLRLSYCPLSLWRWQLYAAQNARSPWNFLPEDTYEQSDEDQDSVKVRGQGSQRQKNAICWHCSIGSYYQISGLVDFNCVYKNYCVGSFLAVWPLLLIKNHSLCVGGPFGN